MKTYAEIQGRQPFDWHAALLSENPNWIMLLDLASSWITCACGNQCDLIPRNKISSAPKDVILKKLGNKFAIFINYEDRNNSLKTLAKIEQRSAILIEKIILRQII